MENYYRIVDCLSDSLWKNCLQRYCDRKINNNGEQILILNLRLVELHLFDMSFVTFCLMIKCYISFTKQRIILQFDRSLTQRNKFTCYGHYYNFHNLEECDTKYVHVFGFYFKDAIEIFDNKKIYEAVKGREQGPRL